LDLSSALGLECTLGVAPDVVMPISVVAGGYDLAFDVGGRGNTVPYGLHLYAQVLVLRPGNGSATAVLDINFQPTA
jgi:hypothetical protein